MQKTLVAATVAALVGVAGAANAADVYSTGGLKDSYVAEPSWTGLYVGLGIGAAAINHDITAKEFDHHGDLQFSGELDGVGGEGVFGTVQVGYDKQYGRFVGGIFFDYDFADANSTLNVSEWHNSASATASLNNSWTVGGRLGYLFTPSTLVYALGGYTEASVTFPFVGSDGQNKDFTLSGYTVGGGIETRLSGNWYLRGEYRFTSLDDADIYNGKGQHCSTIKITDQTDVQTARVVLSYKADIFGGDSIVPLK